MTAGVLAAKSSLQEAVRRFDAFQAHARLAEAHAELDEGSPAKSEPSKINEIIPNSNRLPTEERLRIDAIRSFVLRNYDAAIANYTRLAELEPNDAGRWLDVGRAEEAAAAAGQPRRTTKKPRCWTRIMRPLICGWVQVAGRPVVFKKGSAVLTRPPACIAPGIRRRARLKPSFDEACC